MHFTGNVEEALFGSLDVFYNNKKTARLSVCLILA